MYNEPLFSGLLTLPSNRLAFAAGTAVAACPGDIYNPLWISGPSGTGKTSLLQSILQRIREEHPSKRVRYYQAEDFLRKHILTIQHPGVCDLTEELSELDVVVVDHLNTLAGKDYTQMTIGKLLSELACRGCQVILASTRTPGEMKALCRTLSCHCEHYHQMDISAPTPQEQLEVTRQMAQELNVPLTSFMTIYIALAARSPSHIRCILCHLAARQQLLGPDAGDLSEVLNALLRKEFVV